LKARTPKHIAVKQDINRNILRPPGFLRFGPPPRTFSGTLQICDTLRNAQEMSQSPTSDIVLPR
jgi:hypothetical protein